MTDTITPPSTTTGLTESEADAFRQKCVDFMEAHAKRSGAPTIDEQRAYLAAAAEAGLAGVPFPAEYGGGGLTLAHEKIWREVKGNYTMMDGEFIISHGMCLPMLNEYGTPEQKRQFLADNISGRTMWCQMFSEPGAGSDVASLQSKAELDGDEWVLNGQKVWTSLAEWSDWCFVLARTDRDAPKHKGISFLLIRMDAPGIETRPIVQITGTSEFNEVFFSGARTPADLVVGGVNQGWKVAMGLLSYERGASTLGQQFAFERELTEITDIARANGRAADPRFRQRLADAWSRIEIMRWNSLRMLTQADRPELSGASYISKLYWARLHRDLGELFVDAVGTDALVGERQPGDDSPYELSAAQRLFLYTRADTIYGGSNQIQRNIIGERGLGLPPEPRPPV